MELGTRVRQILVERRLRQRDLARSLKISEGHLSDLLSGRRQFTLEMLGRLGKELDCHVASLLIEGARPDRRERRVMLRRADDVVAYVALEQFPEKTASRRRRRAGPVAEELGARLHKRARRSFSAFR